jgi:hypothetical protein
MSDRLVLTPGLSDAIFRTSVLKVIIAHGLIPFSILLFSIVNLFATGDLFGVVVRFIFFTGISLLLMFFPFRPWRRYVWNLHKARKWNLGVWRVTEFARRRTSGDALTQKARSFDTEMLLGCYHWPDHGPAAKFAIKEDLQSRGLSDEEIGRWLPLPENLVVPPTASAAFRARSVDRGALPPVYFALARLLAFIGAAALLALVLNVIIEVLGDLRDDHLLVAGIAVWAVLIGWGTLLLVVIPIGTLLGLEQTTRILLLRPFGQRSMTSTLKRIVLCHLGTQGHVFTLSDINYRPNPIIRLGDFIATGGRYAVALIVRPSIRIARVKNARTYLELAATLRERLKGAFRSFITGGQAYNIKSTNQWWKWCIDLLMHSSDVVVMDISRVSTGSTWEIEQLDLRNVLPRTIFIAQEAHEAHGVESLQRILGKTQLPRIYLYTAAGKFREPREFDAKLRDTVRQVLRGDQSTGQQDVAIRSDRAEVQVAPP